jgi:hypothetical protein
MDLAEAMRALASITRATLSEHPAAELLRWAMIAIDIGDHSRAAELAQKAADYLEGSRC